MVASALTAFSGRVVAGDPLDGFCIEVGNDPDASSEDVQGFGRAVRRVLTTLSDADPARENVMNANYIHRSSWRFRYNRMDFFVTTFGPCYPKTSSRYAYESKNAYILLQTEQSFLRHDLPPDTPDTDWDHPRNVRDQTRLAFRKAGQEYHVPPTTPRYPTAEQIVKPLRDDGTSVVQWWIPLEERKTKELGNRKTE